MSMTLPAKIELLDTTLRDGAQSESISYSVHDKLEIVRTLSKLGIPLIEAGIPSSNPKDIEFFEYVFTATSHNIRNDVAHAFYIPQDYGIIQATLVFLCILRLTMFSPKEEIEVSI